MTNETQNAEQPAEVLTTTATEPAKKVVELIPYHLHYKQSMVQAKLGKLAIQAAEVLHARLAIHSPKSPAFKQVAEIMSNTRVLMADFMQLEQMIDVARRTANKELYGTEEPNKPMEVVNEPAQLADSTERASA